MDDEDLLALAADLALRAGAAVMEIRRQGFAVAEKPDASPVTEADHAAEAVILAMLRAATPDIPVISEEAMAAGHEPATAGCFWLVDPLDGTREFAIGSNEFTVNIGLVRDHRAVLGAVAVPGLDELFAGIVGRGAWKRTAVGQHPVATRATPSEGATILTSRHHGDDACLEGFLQGRAVASVIPMGSALKFLRLAEGAADLYARFGRTMEWDTAAPQAILEAAGGHMRHPDGTEFRYGKPGWENAAFICFGH